MLQIDVSTYDNDCILAEIKKKRGYKYEDQLICTKENFNNIKSYYKEHKHAEEEMR